LRAIGAARVLHHCLFMSLSVAVPVRSSPFVSPVAYDLDDLDGTITAVLSQRGFLRSVMRDEGETALDVVASEIARLQVTLSVVASHCGGGPIATALVKAYRWTIETAFHLADLQAELLDREMCSADAEAFASRSATSYACVLEPAFLQAGDSHTTSEERALLWDLETARIAIERVLLAIFELG
jgi:hypothetical protein